MTLYAWPLVLVAMAVSVSGAGRGDQQESCGRAQGKCVSRNGCGLALTNYFIDCNSLISGETNVCNKRCKKSLISLLSTDDSEGEAFIKCECGGNSFCETQKERMNVCARDVLPAMKAINDDNTAISCSLAEMICRADTPCLTALLYYEQHCSKLLRGEKCTSRCNNSLQILYRTPKARKLRNCVCDGTEDLPLNVPCQTLQQNTERLCFGRSGTSFTPMTSFSLDDDTVTHAHHHQHGRHNGTRHKGKDSRVDSKPHTSTALCLASQLRVILLTLIIAILSTNRQLLSC